MEAEPREGEPLCRKGKGTCMRFLNDVVDNTTVGRMGKGVGERISGSGSDRAEPETG